MDDVFHLARQDEWEAAQSTGFYKGSEDDRADGFLHFSTGQQIVASARKHRAGETGLVLLRVPPNALGADLKWEVSRGGSLFPHLYGELPVSAVKKVDPLPLDEDGQHIFPALN